MKKCFLPFFLVALHLLSVPVFSQKEHDSTLLGLPGDNLDLYAVLDIFLKSKTIEAFEKSLNEQKTGINNLDLDLDKKVDFIKVVTTKKDSSFTFVLQVAVSKTETQDVAVIMVDKDKNKKVKVQIVGDPELYGKNYIVEPRTKPTPSVTANPAYEGPEPVTKNVPASTTTVVVETVPIVQYVYSPAYVPYVPPYYYGFYPPYFAAFTVMAVGIYRANHYYGHYGGYHNTVVINNSNRYNNYNNGNRNTSDRVQHNNANGSYGNRASTRPSNGASASTRPAGGASASNRPSNGGPSASTRPANQPSASNRQSGSDFSSSNRSSSGSQGRTRSSGSSSYGGGGSRGGGSFGGSRGGGGGRRR